MSDLTPEQRDNLQAAIDRWLPPAQKVGCMHGNWEMILDARALLNGTETLLRGTGQEVYATLMKYTDK